MSTAVPVRNGQYERGIILHERLISTLREDFLFDEESAELVDKVVVELAKWIYQVSQHKRRVDELEARPLCSGTDYWPSDNEGYMKVNHGVGDNCPMHGKHHKPKKRLRIGIGRDKADIRAVKEAMVDHADWVQAKDSLRRAKYELGQVQRRVNQAIGIYRY